MNPIGHALAQQPYLIVDGAMATELEKRGADLNDPLWSAKVLLENPGAIEAVHFDYFLAGADVAITASYQASFEGYARRGLDRAATAALLRRSVELARNARERFMASDSSQGRVRPLVAASVGPYGAYLADGSEYRGDYGLNVDKLVAWHRPRFAVLAESGADLLACETIPTLVEGEALARLLDEYRIPGWLSFSCKDGAHLHHGESIREAAALAEATECVVAMGVNCTAPRYVEELLEDAGQVTSKPLVCYPNSGEVWDGANHCWLPGTGVTEFGEPAYLWANAGAKLIGGCCRTGPEEIRAIRAALL